MVAGGQAWPLSHKPKTVFGLSAACCREEVHHLSGLIGVHVAHFALQVSDFVLQLLLVRTRARAATDTRELCRLSVRGATRDHSDASATQREGLTWPLSTAT